MGLLQADDRWSLMQLGDGDATIGGEGCGLLCLVNAARRLRTWPDVIPPHANAALKKASAPPAGPCFVDGETGQAPGSSLIFERAAAVLRMSSPQTELVEGAAGDVALAAAVKKHLDAGDLAIIHVDFASEGRPRHFILAAERLTDGRVWCDDPATGFTSLSADGLEGLADWRGVKHRYRARGVRPLRALPGAASRDFAVAHGDRGPAVAEVQTLLNAWGTSRGRQSLVVDGDFGDRTRAAVEVFQEAQGIAVDGVVGPVTSRALLQPR